MHDGHDAAGCFSLGRGLAVLAIGLASCALSGPCLASPITVEEIIRITPGGTVRGLLATVDLTDPRVQIVTTGTSTGSCGDATLTTVPNWRTAVAADLAINANFFSTCSGTRADIIGLAFADGVEVSPARRYQPTTLPDPAITFTQSRVAAIDYVAPGTTAGIWDGVAGVGPSNTDSDPGTMLITDGVNTGATARVTPLTREPRTAVAVNRAGTTLYMLVIDGRQPTWSVGMTLPEVADLFLERGAWRAINLDGGGSSSFVYRRPDNSIQQNKPSDSGNVHRAVSNHLGIKLAASTVTDRWERPVRGVWIRPPELQIGASFESVLPTLRSAGIQDIYLETFYWGLATNSSSVYNDRFGYDYLAQAIVTASRYGMRVHAWCEIGYQGFGTSGDYLLSPTGVGDQNGRTGNPEWRVQSRSGGTVYGDGTAGQMFVNLIHPGVRARLGEYMAELAEYPGLAGIQIDYCRYPLDDNGSDGFPAPWSYDSWSRSAFQAAGFGDPFTTAATTTDPQWNQFVSWRRNGITETINTLYASVNATNTGVQWAGAVFPTPLNASQLTKMQDWGSWTAQYGLQLPTPMCYSSTQSGITSEVNSALTVGGAKRLVPGLAPPGPGVGGTHPEMAQQLAAITGATRRIEDFVLFDYRTLLDSTSGGSARRTALKTWIDSTAAAMVGDINDDGYVDARDMSLFNTLFTGTPIAANAGNRRYDLSNNGTIDAEDRRLLGRQFSRFRFGEDGVVDVRDLQALRNAFVAGGPPVAGVPLNLYDLNGDGSVNILDEQAFYPYVTIPLNLPPDADVNRDGVVDVRDLVEQMTGIAVDVNRDGVINADDSTALVSVLRADEPGDLNQR